MKVVVAGLGYVGLSLACLLSNHHDVVGVDVAKDRVDAVNAGVSPIADAEIEEFFSSGGKLMATLDARSAYEWADWVLVATPTDYDASQDRFDTSAVESVLDACAEVSSKATVVIKSTVPVGYTKRISQAYPQLTILFSPEFLREGHALYDNQHPSRVIAGAPLRDDAHESTANRFVDMLVESATVTVPRDRQLVIGSTEAEAIKLFSNTYLAMRVAFFNELDTYAMNNGLSAEEIISGVGHDPRIGMHYNNPSFGYGGYCLPKDSRQLLAQYGDTPQELMSAIVASNVTRKRLIATTAIERARENRRSAGDDLSQPVIGIYRLTMKTGSDNFRKAAIIDVIEQIAASGVQMLVYEPFCTEELFMGNEVVADFDAFARRCDLIIANRWNDELADVSDRVFTRDVFRCD